MRRILTALGTALALVLVSAPMVATAAAGDIATEVHRIDTSSWSPPSPDPAGLTYRGSTGRLLASDSEVDEIPSLYTGQNLFEASPDGTLLDTGNTDGDPRTDDTNPSNDYRERSLEAADVAWDNNPGAQVLYVADDDLDKVFRYNPQADGRLGTADDTSATALSLNTMILPGYPDGITDAEGLAYRTSDRSLYLTDGVTAAVFHIERGPDGQFGGATSDDVVTRIDAAAVGMHDPEDVEYDPVSGHLFIASRTDDQIAETTASGELVNLFDISDANIDPAGITLAPASDASGDTHLYVSHRGVDAEQDPAENDGLIVEFSLDPAPVNQDPVLSQPEDQFSVEGEVISLQVVASDPDGDDLTYSATNLPAGLTIDENSGLISGTIADGANGSYAVQVAVTDGSGSAIGTFSWTVTVNNRPPTVTSPSDQESVEGEVVSLPINGTDPEDGPLTWTATNLPPNLAIDPETGVISGTVAAGASAGSPYQVEVTATDDGGLTDSASFPWVVRAVPASQPPVVTNPGNQTDAEGEAVSLQVQASDPDTTDLTYSAVGLPPGLFIGSTTGLIEGTISPGAAANSPYSVQVSASDGHDTDTESFTWTVTDAPAGVALRGVSTAMSATGTVVKALTIATPAGVQSGDVMVAAITVRSSATISPPAGFTQVRASVIVGGDLRQVVYVGVAGATVPASWRFGLSSRSVVAGAIAAYSGVNTATPVEASGARKNASSTAIVAPSVTSTVPGSMLVGAFGIATNATMTPPATMTEQVDIKTGRGPKKVALELADETLDAPGATGQRVATASAAAVNIGTVIVLRPA